MKKIIDKLQEAMHKCGKAFHACYINTKKAFISHRKDKRRRNHVSVTRSTSASRVYSKSGASLPSAQRFATQRKTCAQSSIWQRIFKRFTPKITAIAISCLAVMIAVPVIIASAAGNPAQSSIVLAANITPGPDSNTAGQESTNAGASSTLTDSGIKAGSSDVTAVEEPTPTVEPTPSYLKKGITDAKIADIQARLMDLGYMDEDEPTEYFGPATQLAVQLFQRKHGLAIDGYVGDQTLALLNSAEAKPYSVSVGVEGTDVEELQKRLYELGYISKVTSYFGTDTEAAVKKFQERNGLTVDGSVGAQTREKLYSEDAIAHAYSAGEESEEIRTFQNKLHKLGYLTTNPDGKYGADTVAAVKRFQERNGLIADGYLGPQTKALLKSSDAQSNALSLGMSGNDVERVQKRLIELKYLKGSTGYFGSSTEDAVERFQKRNGLTVDGKVGPATLNALLSSKAKAAATTTTSNSNKTTNKNNNTSSSNKNKNSNNTTSNPIPATSGANVSSFLTIAKSRLGCKYVRGGKGPNTFDCSGFVYWCLNQAGVKQGYMTSSTWQKVTKYQRINSLSELQAGDVVSFKGHVGICLGGGQMIDASSGQGKVRITQISSPYWQRNFVAGFRIF